MIRTLLGKKTPVSRWALALGLGSSLAALGAVNAQQANAPAEETQAAERVIVTGSNIPSAAEVGGAEVTTIDQEAIVRTGTDDPQVALQLSDPAFSGGGNIGSSNASINATSTNGGSAVSILGLPTLVLLDGRRIADSAALAAGGGQFQDVNLFPASLIKKIEVLKDGASAIYGSDAVGGVVNVLLNTDYEGFEISGRYGFAEKGDIADNRESAIAGFGDDKTRIVVAAQYEQQDPVLQNQRSFANVETNPATGYGGYVTSNFGGKISLAGSDQFLNTGLPLGTGGAVILRPGSIPTNLNSLSQVAPVGSIPLVTITNPTGPTTQGFAAAELPAGSYTSNTNLADLQSLVGITLDQDRTNAYGSVERDIFDKLLTVFGSFIFTQNYSESLLAPQPVTTDSSPNASQNVVIPIGSPYNPFAATIGSSLGIIGTGTATVGGKTVPAGGLIVTNRFLDEPRVFRNDTDFYRIVAGVKGEIFKDYNYELGFNHSQDEIDYKNFGLIRSDLLEEALAGGYTADGAADPAVIATSASGVQTVTHPAGPYSKVNGTLLPALDAFAFNNPASTSSAVTGTDIRDQLSTLTVVDGSINGFPVTLPAGPLGFALGGEYRDEGLKLNDSSENFVASVPVADVEVSRGIEAGYGEVSIPVISPSMKIPGLYSLDLDGAGRYEKYDGINSSVVPKASFVLRPVVDVALRGTFSGSFLAPNLIETNGPPGAGFTSATDLGAGYTEQGNAITTSNPHLGPTRAYTWSSGIVISPSKVPGLTMSADFFHVEEEGIVSGTGAPDTTILQEANTLGSASPYNSFIHFGSPTGPNLTSTKPGQITGNAADYFVVTSLANELQQRTSAVDFNFNYDHDFGPKIGGATVGLNGTYYLQAKGNDTPGGPNYDQIGLYLGETYGDGNYTPQYKLAPYAEYRYGGFTLSGLGNYTPSLRDGDFLDTLTDRKGDYTTESSGNLPKIRDYFIIDLTLSYEFGLNKPNPTAPTPPPTASKDAKGGDGKEVATTQPTVAKQLATLKLLDGLKLTFGVNNISNARPPLISASPDFDNTDASIYDPFQRYFYFVVSKKF